MDAKVRQKTLRMLRDRVALRERHEAVAAFADDFSGVQKAGGLVTDLGGEQDFMQSGDICAATPKVFPLLLEALR